jgi:hypothetical protein
MTITDGIFLLACGAAIGALVAHGVHRVRAAMWRDRASCLELAREAHALLTGIEPEGTSETVLHHNAVFAVAQLATTLAGPDEETEDRSAMIAGRHRSEPA